MNIVQQYTEKIKRLEYKYMHVIVKLRYDTSLYKV